MAAGLEASQRESLEMRQPKAEVTTESRSSVSDHQL
jgi:hypothetical protein